MGRPDRGQTRPGGAAASLTPTDGRPFVTIPVGCEATPAPVGGNGREVVVNPELPEDPRDPLREWNT